MGNSTITRISIEQLKKYSHQEAYADDYIFMSDRMDDAVLGEKCVKIDAFVFIYCEVGELTVALNNVTQHISEGNTLFILPNTIIEHIMTSFDNKVHILCFSSQFLQRITQTEKNLWPVIEQLRTNPVHHFTDDERKRISHYIDLLENKMHKEMDQYQKDILLHLSAAVFCEMIATTHGATLTESRQATEDESPIKQSDFIFKRFMELLSTDNGRHRTVEYYARKLCYTSKYLSMIIKQVSGRNALALINENAIEHIISELRHSDKDIKQIAFEFDFTNNSFFTRFFKKHTGMTPTEFRSNTMGEQRLNRK